MLFENVAIAGLAHVDAPNRVTSMELEDRLMPAIDRLGMRRGLLTDLAGIQARRWWDEGVRPSDAATLAAEKLFAQVDVPREKVGVVFNTSVCRDYLEPSTACLVHGNLGLGAHCLNYDLGNACLAFLNAMELAGTMLERGAIDYALVVDGEGSRRLQNVTIERLLQPDSNAEMFRDQFASLTLGSGGVAMLLTRGELCPDGPRFRGGVSVAATEHSRLCWGHAEQMVTDTKALLFAGVSLAQRTWVQAQEILGWRAAELDQLMLHQVSQVHTMTLCQTLGLDASKAHLIYPEFGNVGPASVPMTLSKAADEGKFSKGERIALMGIGSGLNCSMMEIVW